MIKEKIKSSKELKNILSSLKDKNKRVVFTNGCFDLIHAGHVAYLEGAKGHGDILVVAVNSDSSVKRLKGAGRPIVGLNDRMKIVAALESVDFVTFFEEDDPFAIVKELNPDVIVKGADWKEDEIIGGSYVRGMGGKVATIPFLKGYSTTSIIKKIKELK